MTCLETADRWCPLVPAHDLLVKPLVAYVRRPLFERPRREFVVLLGLFWLLGW